MNENVKIALIVLTPLLVGGVLLYLTRGNRKRQFFLLSSIILVANVWSGFAYGWRTSDFVQLGFVVILIVASFFDFRAPAQK